MAVAEGAEPPCRDEPWTISQPAHLQNTEVFTHKSIIYNAYICFSLSLYVYIYIYTINHDIYIYIDER